MKRHNYKVETPSGFVNCKSKSEAEYVYSCWKNGNHHAKLYEDNIVIAEI